MTIRSRGSFALFNAILTVVIAAPSVAQVRATIHEPGERRFPIAVSPLKAASSDARDVELATSFADIVAGDLSMSGIFRVIPREAYIERAADSGVGEDTIHFENWSVVGALTLVKGTLRREGKLLTVEARLFDVYQRRQLYGRVFKGVEETLPRMAHRFADQILEKLSGRRGPFDSRIVFLSNRGGRFKDVYVTTLDGRTVRRVTKTRTLNLAPSWGPGLSSILLTSYRHGGADLFSIDVTRGQWSPVSQVPGLDLGGRWSPDGTRIAVTRENDGNSDIFILDPSGKLRVRLTGGRAIDVSPHWSPDGERLVFCSNRSGSPQIYIARADGGGVRRITYSGNYNTSPDWSPSGDRIAYVSRVGGTFQVFTIPVDGGEASAVTHAPGDNEGPSWSPDGRYLVFSSTRSGHSHLYVADASGRQQVELTRGGGDDTSPAWSGWIDGGSARPARRR